MLVCRTKKRKMPEIEQESKDVLWRMVEEV